MDDFTHVEQRVRQLEDEVRRLALNLANAAEQAGETAQFLRSMASNPLAGLDSPVKVRLGFTINTPTPTGRVTTATGSTDAYIVTWDGTTLTTTADTYTSSTMSTTATPDGKYIGSISWDGGLTWMTFWEEC